MKIVLIAAGAAVVIVIAAFVVLASVDIPAPSGQVEKTIPTDTLFR